MSQDVQAHPSEPLFSVEDLSVAFKTKKGMLTAVDHLSFSVNAGEILSVVGESGCGKSITSLAIMGLLPSNARVSSGSIVCEGVDLLTLSEKELCQIRGNVISMVFQDPMTALNPTLTVGAQLMEPFMIHQGCSKEEARARSVEMLRQVGIPAPEQRIGEYPHQMSGGMLQRVVIAMALACKPKVLIADEPTTALDVTIQAQILDLIKEISRTTGTAVILITHDMGVVAETADRTLVLYAGRAVEYGTVEQIFSQPRHPYTQALLRSIPSIHDQAEWLETIPGMVPSLDAMPAGCRFAPRCAEATEECGRRCPQMYATDQQQVGCLQYCPKGSNPWLSRAMNSRWSVSGA